MAPITVARRPRLTPRRVSILLILGLVALQALVAFSAPYWARLLQRPVRNVPEVDEAVASAAPTPTPPPAEEVERRINVKLLFEAEDRPGLVMEERAVGYAPDLGTQLELVLRELFRGSTTGLLPPLDPATRVLEVFVTPGGTAYVDLSAEAVPTGGAGSQVEEHSVYAIVNTLTVNFPAVKRVQILVEDRPVVSLAGHTDLSQPLLPDMTLLAPVEVTPSLPAGSESAVPGVP